MPAPAAPAPTEILHQAASSGALEGLSTPLQVALFLGGLAFLSAALVCVTAFTRIIIVLSFVRRALTTQEIPPTPVILGLALFLTLFVMGPTIDAITRDAINPSLSGSMPIAQALEISGKHLQTFMLHHTRRKDLALFIHMSGVEAPQTAADTPLRVLIPAFVVSELKTAFIMGFCIYIPFLLVDLVVSTVLMALGMMMMPPVVVSLPFKILLFVLVDGWHLIAQAVSASFG